jgi:hypothetical protein
MALTTRYADRELRAQEADAVVVHELPESQTIGSLVVFFSERVAHHVPGRAEIAASRRANGWKLLGREPRKYRGPTYWYGPRCCHFLSL